MKTLSIDIRRAEPADAQDVADVHVTAWTGAYSGLIPHRALSSMLARRGAAWWESAIRRAASVLVIEIGGEIVGYSTFGRNRARELPQEGEIYELYIRPEYQGLGLGTRLFDATREAMRDHGLKGLVVWALEDNALAMGFYAGRGGKDIAEGVEVFDAKALRKVAFIWR